MSSEITATSLVISGTAKRSIPILHRFASTTVSFPSGAGTLVLTDSVLASQTRDGGFTYSNGLYTNTSGVDLVVLVSYGILWNNDSTGRNLAWIQLDNLPQRYAMTNIQSSTLEPTSTGMAVIVVPAGSFLRLWVFQNTVVSRGIVALYGMPYFNICVI